MKEKTPEPRRGEHLYGPWVVENEHWPSGSGPYIIICPGCPKCPKYPDDFDD